MLDKFRSFKDSKYAMVLVAMIAIPFVLWGMDGTFQSGKTNSIGKINNYNISTKEFIEHITLSRLDENYIRENVKTGIIEDLLSELVSEKIIDLEIKKYGISITDNNLAEIIKKNYLFFDENNKFSRIKYEKFLLENYLTAQEYEENIKKNTLKNILFNYVGNGINSPYFVANQKYVDQTKKIKVKYLNLNYSYKNNFTKDEIEKFISKNKNSLKREEIDLFYVKLTPEILIDSQEYNNEFFNKIDEIENMILDGSNINQIKEKFNFEINNVNNYYLKNNENNEILKEIYLARNDDKIKIIDKNDYLLLYEIKNIKEILPDLNDDDFNNLIKDKIKNYEKTKLHNELIEKIKNKKVNPNIFSDLSKNNDQIVEVEINNINDTKIFDSNSINLIYSLPKNSYALVANANKEIFFIKILNINFNNLDKNSSKFNEYDKIGSLEIKKNLLSSYDLYLNSKYNIEINENSLKRVKNYFE